MQRCKGAKDLIFLRCATLGFDSQPFEAVFIFWGDFSRSVPFVSRSLLHRHQILTWRPHQTTRSWSLLGNEKSWHPMFFGFKKSVSLYKSHGFWGSSLSFIIGVFQSLCFDRTICFCWDRFVWWDCNRITPSCESDSMRPFETQRERERETYYNLSITLESIRIPFPPAYDIYVIRLGRVTL